MQNSRLARLYANQLESTMVQSWNRYTQTFEQKTIIRNLIFKINLPTSKHLLDQTQAGCFRGRATFPSIMVH